MKLTSIRRAVLLATLISLNVFLLFAAGTAFEFHWLVVCSMSIAGTIVGGLRSADDRVVGSLVGSALTVFIGIGLIMSVFGRLFA